MSMVKARGMIPLGLLSSGEQGEIVEIRAGKTALSGQCGTEREKGDSRVEDMGLRPGKRVEMLCNGGNGAVLLKVDEARVAIDRRTAMKIMIKEVGQ